MDALDHLLENHKTLSFDFTIDNVLKIVKIVKERDETAIKEYDETIPQIEQQVEDDEYFQKNNYFQDMDVLGYRDLSWKKFMNYMCNIGTNNNPVKHKKLILFHFFNQLVYWKFPNSGNFLEILQLIS
jgi:hypothetical protein